MEVHFTPEQEAQLSRIASHNGTDAEQVVKETINRMLENQARFLAGIQKGIATAERGEFVEPAEVWANVEKILQS